MLNSIRCPSCGGELCNRHNISCASCNTVFPVRGGVIDLAPDQKFVYSLQSLPTARFRQLVDEARERGFENAFQRYLFEDHERRSNRPRRSRFRRFFRDLMLSLNGRTIASNVRTVFYESPASLWLLTGMPRDGKILDLGAGWSATSHIVARHCGHVVAADPTMERLQLSAIRAAGSGAENMTFVRTPTSLELPFADKSFDLVMLNGVLEWMPASVTEGEPVQVQEKILAEVRRILQPGGQLLVAIENRYAFGDLIGFPEGHMGLPWVGVLPRVVARPYHWLVKKKQMRVTTHSRRDLESLLENAGFNSAETAVFAPQPTYAWFDMIGSANKRAAATLPVTTLLDHPLFRKRESAPVLRGMVRLFRSNVAAFAAVASQGPWKSIICEIAELVSSHTRLDIRLPVEGLGVRESKVMIQARCHSTNALVHISLGMTDAGNSRLLTESTTLRSLEHMDTIRRGRLVVPKVLWQGDFRGQFVEVLSHVDGIAMRPSSRQSSNWDLTMRVLEMLRECSDSDAAIHAAITINDLWNERWQIVEPLWHSSHLRHLAAVTQESLRPSNEEAVKIAKFGHGDLHPQNILVCSDGHTIGTIDWECAGPSHPYEDALACGLGHLRQQHRGIGESIIALVQAIPEHMPPSISSFLPASELEPDRIRTLLAFVWLRRLANAQGTAVLMDPEWLHKRAFCVLESFNNIVRK